MSAPTVTTLVIQSENYQRLRALLHELFQFDRADLDFGIYRIMNQRREDIEKFLDEDLLPQIREALGTLEDHEQQRLIRELQLSFDAEDALGMTRGSSPKAIEFQAMLDERPSALDLEADVFGDLYKFFNRYYDEGDFISLRRYKAGVYAIPYEGEETKFYWANDDQYYVKTMEDFRDYRFKLNDGRHVRFRLVTAETGRENNRTESGKGRRFILQEEQPLVEVDGELELHFEFRLDPAKQAELNTSAIRRLLADPTARPWRDSLFAKLPSANNAERTVLAKHLADYTAKNTFDYFIHKDLARFLRRELDFFLKNEVLHIDDLDTDDERRAEQYLARLRAIKRVGHKIIDFLAQLEDFQKLLFLKKKFVVETNYCVTLDRILGIPDGSIRDSLLAQIATSDAQRDEWINLFAIDEIAGDAERPGYSVPLTTAFVTANPNLVLDTRFFSADFTARLLATIDDLDATLDGLLIHGDNFQALRLLERRFHERVKCIYIDPPYNTNSSAIPYKNDYRHSSWITMMRDRLALLHSTLTADGAIFVSIDKAERTGLEHALDDVFAPENRVEELIWSMNTNNSQAINYSTNHEYVEVYAKDRRVVDPDKTIFREPKPGFAEVMALVDDLNPAYPPVSEIEADIKALYERHKAEYREHMEAQGLDWKNEKGKDPWKGIFNYSRAEYREADGTLVPEREAKDRQAKIWVWRESDSSMPASKQAESTRDPNHSNWRFYKPLHPRTGKPVPHPKSGWKFAFEDDTESPDRESFSSLDQDGRIAWGVDERKVPQRKRFLHEAETNIGKSVFHDNSDGEKEISAMFGRSGIFLSPKHSTFVSRLISHAAKPDSVIIDCFAGTGSTAHAVISLNRADGGTRKYVLAEVGEYFDTVLKPRVLKAIYSKDWRNGKPVSRSGSSHALKYLRLVLQRQFAPTGVQPG